jgi:CRP/FNR family transcriptional regulator
MATPKTRTPRQQVSCIGCSTCDTAEWSALSRSEIEQINAAKSSRHYRSGDVIYEQDEPCTGIYCIESGMVAVRQLSADGTAKIMRTVEFGETIGYADFFGGGKYRTGAYCLEPGIVCHIPGDLVRKFLANSPDLGLAFLTHGAQALHEADASSLRQSVYTVRLQLAHVILRFKDRHGTAQDDGTILLQMPMTWTEVSQMIGARPETISRALQSLSHDNILRSEGRRIFIDDLDLLLDEVERVEAG